MKQQPSTLALNGGPQVRTKPFPNRGLLGKEEKAAVDALFDQAISSGDAFGYNGPDEDAYCREFAEFMGGGYADAVNSGTSAVYVALRALDPEPFTEIIVSPITDPGGIMPIVMLNCIPVIADSAPGRYNTGPEQVIGMISPLTSAIVIAHIGGEPVDLEPIVEAARKRNIPLVEDCAQAHGAKIHGKMVGTFGDIAAFSTMFGKHHCTGGQGGVVFTKSEKLYWEARRAADRGKPFGLPDGSTNSRASLNFNLSDIAAAIGRVQLKKLPEIVRRRRDLVARIGAGCKKLKAVSLPPAISGAEASYWFLRLRIDLDRLTCDLNTFCQALGAEGIAMGGPYRHLPHTQDWYRNRRVFGRSGYPWAAPQYKGDPNREFPCPNAIAATESHFNLPINENWGEEEAADIVTALKKLEACYLK